MKRKSLLFGFVALVCSFICQSCSSDDMDEVGTYNISFSFTDKSGNNLISGIRLEEWIPSNQPQENATSGVVDGSRYHLDVILSTPSDKWNNETYNTYGRPGYTPDSYRQKFTINDTKNPVLTNQFLLPLCYCQPQNILTYKIVLQSFFGDDDVHEFKTYWQLPNNTYTSYTAICVRAECDGKDYRVKDGNIICVER